MTLAKLCCAQLLVSTVAGRHHHHHTVDEAPPPRWSKEKQARKCIRHVTAVSAPRKKDGIPNATWWEQSLRVAAKKQDLEFVKFLTTDGKWIGFRKPRSGSTDEKHHLSALWYAATAPKTKDGNKIIKLIIRRLFGDADTDAVEKVFFMLKQCDKYKHLLNNVLRQFVKSEKKLNSMSTIKYDQIVGLNMCRMDSFRHESLRWLSNHRAWPALHKLLHDQAKLDFYKHQQKIDMHDLAKDADEMISDVDQVAMESVWLPVIGQLKVIKWVFDAIRPASRQGEINRLNKLCEGGPLHQLKQFSWYERMEVLLLYSFHVQRHNGAFEAVPQVETRKGMRPMMTTKEEMEDRYADCKELIAERPECLKHKLINPFLEYINLKHKR